MFGLDWKSLAIGVAVGYFVLPHVTAPIMTKIGELKAGETSAS